MMDERRLDDRAVAKCMVRRKQTKSAKLLTTLAGIDDGLNLLWTSAVRAWGSGRALRGSVNEPSFCRHRRICAELAPIASESGGQAAWAPVLLP
jgi:hypothetical protein